MTETAIPINHSFIEAETFLAPPDDSNKQDMAIAELAAQPGWAVLEKQITSEIERLKQTNKFDQETMEEYGFRVYAAQQCRSHLEWVLNNVRGTAATIAKRDQ